MVKTALVHDWLTTLGGAEKCLQSIQHLFPSPLFTLVCDPALLSQIGLTKTRVITSFIQKLPWAKRHYPRYLPLFPLAIEQFDLSSYDLILSSSHAVAKGVVTSSDQWHICYCHTPMRYAWDLYHLYLTQHHLQRTPKGFIAKIFLHYLRLWDAQSAQRVDAYIANSHYVAARIKKTYRRNATVIYPPVNTRFFTPYERKEPFYLTVSRLVPYKNTAVLLDAFSLLPDKTLVVIGAGPKLKALRQKAPSNVELLGYQDDATLKKYLQRAQAFIFPSLEDFGILPVEAQACGTPVIAYGKGGALETVIEGTTGLFFREPTAASLVKAIQTFEQTKEHFRPSVIRAHAETFSEEHFQRAFKHFVDMSYAHRQDVSLRRRTPRTKKGRPISQ